MARKLLELNTDEGGAIVVAVDVPDESIKRVAKSGEQVIEKMEQSFDAVKDLILRSCRPLTEAFQTLYQDSQATKAEVEFGINFTAKGNLYLVETSGTASLKVKITWDLDKSSDR
ncbi:MAG: hypothetical protein J7647_32435 [Cyanobacteria bacterium SBLK]|nr:hypothetical protein [Cyanobacteria bacterium SBLK]